MRKIIITGVALVLLCAPLFAADKQTAALFAKIAAGDITMTEIRNADLNARNEAGQTVFHVITEERSAYILSSFYKIRYGKAAFKEILLLEVDAYNKNALEAQRVNPEICDILIEESGLTVKEILRYKSNFPGRAVYADNNAGAKKVIEKKQKIKTNFTQDYLNPFTIYLNQI
ncbi:hypothetical protein Dip510_000327 [Elusimicrobium posterum]|uniref:hypothetical protein n=1 Tax=Elusimicrobium posterum TaxID=3116653 RepID=UPI003C793C05